MASTLRACARALHSQTLAPLSTPLEMMRFCRTVELSRTTIGHALNARSSRSHCLVTLHVAQRDGPTLTTKKVSAHEREIFQNARQRLTPAPRSSASLTWRAPWCAQLLIVDLAGSERIAKSGVEGVTRLAGSACLCIQPIAPANRPEFSLDACDLENLSCLATDIELLA